MMLDKLLIVNNKVNTIKKRHPTNGIIYSDSFATDIETYPAFTFNTSDYVQYCFNTERNIDYYRDGIFWLSKQIFTQTLKSKNKMFLDFDYYSFLESCTFLLKTITPIKLLINETPVLEFLPETDRITIEVNRLLYIGDFLSTNEFDGLVQIKYRLVG